MSMRKIFAKSENSQDDVFINHKVKDILTDLDAKIKTVNVIAINTNFFSKYDYPFSTSPIFFEIFIKNLRDIFQGKINIIESRFTDYNDLYYEKIRSIFKKFNLNFESFENSTFFENSNPEKQFDGFYIPQGWWESGLRIVLANSRVHKHHFVKIPRGIMANLMTLCFINKKIPEKFSKAKYLSMIQYDWEYYINDLWNTVKDTLPFYGVLDARMIALSNEHSFFLKTKDSNKILYGWDARKIDEKFFSKE